MRIVIVPNNTSTLAAGQVATAELHFSSAATNEGYPDPVVLDGLKLIGFGVWQQRDGRLTVTFPARQYQVNGERRSFALLRPQQDINDQLALKTAIIEAYERFVDAQQQEEPRA